MSLSDIMRFKRGQKATSSNSLMILMHVWLNFARRKTAPRTKKDYTESVVTDQKGNEQLSQGAGI